MNDASKGNNRIMITADGGYNRYLPTMRFLVEGSNVASLRSTGGGGRGAPRTMNEC